MKKEKSISEKPKTCDCDSCSGRKPIRSVVGSNGKVCPFNDPFPWKDRILLDHGINPWGNC